MTKYISLECYAPSSSCSGCSLTLCRLGKRPHRGELGGFVGITTCFLLYCPGEREIKREYVYKPFNRNHSDMKICIDHLTLYTSSDHLQELINKDVTKLVRGVLV